MGVILATVTGVFAAHQYLAGAGRPLGVDALCPFGGVETLFTLISGAGFIEKTAASAVVLLAGMIVVALLYRRSFCGQICPLGTLQGLFGSLGGKVFRKRPEVPRGVDRFARFLKYGVLAFFAIWTWQAATLVMRPYDPWVAFAHLTSAELFAELGIGLTVLGVSLAGSAVYERFFCKYLCPTGALLGALSKISVFGIRRDAEACIDCGACDKACPMNIPVSSAEKVTASECISCNECVNACPAAGALEIKAPNGKRVSPALMTGIVVAAIAAIIATSTAAGAFAWTMPSLGEAVEQQGATQGAPFDTSLIKGYMSMKEVSKASGVPEARFVEKWGVPEADLGKPMNEIADQYGFSPDDVRPWVAEQLGQ
jgi:polyferredoxin